MPRAPAFRPIPSAEPPTLGDHRRFPGCRLVATCALCGWAKGYSAERAIGRLRQLRAGGEATPVGAVAARIAWPCPMCGRVKWRTDLAWPPGLDDRAIRRLAAMSRN